MPEHSLSWPGRREGDLAVAGARGHRRTKGLQSGRTLLIEELMASLWAACSPGHIARERTCRGDDRQRHEQESNVQCKAA